MSSEPAIQVENVSKSFAIYERPHHRLLQQLFPNARRGWFREFHALRDISFEVGRGETIGIVGRNGSGKSTLLQLICGTMSPTAGNVRIHGRIAALLELGAGFNPEFTGRENVFLNGTVLGLQRDEIERRFDDIAAFADIGDFIEQPVKNYSSGMYVRLAFAVAINVTPDILVIDEALSVGDEAFQRKCFSRIQRMRDDGATVLFVSHAAGTVLELCNRAILLDRGECLANGAPRQVVSRYQQLLYAPAERQLELREAIRADTEITPLPSGDAARESAADVETDDAFFDPALQSQSTVVYPSRGAQIIDPHIETLSGRRVNVLRPGGVYVYTFRVAFERAAAGVRFGMLLKTTTGVELAGGVSAQAQDALPCVDVGQEFVVQFQFRCLLAPGPYFANAGVLGREGESEQFLDRRVDVVMFRVMPDLARLATAYVDLDLRSTVQGVGGTGCER